jgi:excisionase family DNA binding protein
MEAAKEYEVPLPTIYYWLQKGVLTHVSFGGGRYLIPEKSLEDLCRFRNASPSKPRKRMVHVPVNKAIARKLQTPAPIILIINDNELSLRNIAVACSQLSCVAIFVRGLDEAAQIGESTRPAVIWSESNYSIQQLSELAMRCAGSLSNVNMVIEHDSERGGSLQPPDFGASRWNVVGPSPSEASIVRVLHGCGVAFQHKKNLMHGYAALNAPSAE